jgi:hypothetical protein
MTWELHTPWQPTSLLRVGESHDSSTGTTEVLTDAGPAYIKPLGNRQGPHVLASDWVGTHLARWFGLSTFDIAFLELGESDLFPLPRGYKAEMGPAFASRAVRGFPWGKSAEELDSLVNPDDVTRLVVFDTWTLNCDRHFPAPEARKPNYDNVFLSTEGVEAGKTRLVAMDHGLCFIRSGEELTERVSHIEKVRDERIYGLFPAFAERLRANVIDDCVIRLKTVNKELAASIVKTIPLEWEVGTEARTALVELIWCRAQFVADNIEQWIEQECPWFGGRGGQS